MTIQPNFSENAQVILSQRYLMKDEDGAPIEDSLGLLMRVASAVAMGQPAAIKRDDVAAEYYDLMASLRFLPNSPTLVNAGTGGRGCLSACFVVSPEDNMDSIMQVASDAAMIEKWGGGIGFGFSNLRPKNDPIATTHGDACGPISVMKLYSSVGATLTQGAFRQGAHMGQLIITHPDVREFIHCKDNDAALANFNISVQITDDFMHAVNNDEDWTFYNPRDTGDGPANEVAGTIRARDLWREICESAWKTGDPGVVFMDRVWDTQPNPQMGDIQTSNPCGEEFLENYGNCCLGSCNLERHVVVQGGTAHLDFNALGKTVRSAVRFLNDVIEVNQFPLEKLREVNLATRRIGLGVMGWADALVLLGIPYDSAEGVALANKVGKFIVDTAWDESAKIAAERGPFSEYENSALKAQGFPPVRNSSVFTIAPTGTISRLSDCSSGIEPHFANAWWSNVLWKGDNTDGSGTAGARLLDAPKSVRDALVTRLGSSNSASAVLSRIADNPAAAQDILSSHGIDASVFRTAMEISPEAHVRMQAAWQKYVTNSVSKTINLPNDATVEDVERAYRLAWETGCKAVTVYRDGSKSMQVLQTGTDSAENGQNAFETTHDSNGYLVPRERPDAVIGITEKVRTGHGTMYVTVNFDQNEEPFEIFTAIGKAGGSEPAHLEGLSRMVTLCLRAHVDPDSVIHHLKGITSEPVWDKGSLIRSAEDGIAQVLAWHRHGINNPGRNGADTEARQIGIFKPSAKPTTAAQPSRQQRLPKQGLPQQGLACIKCGGRVVHQEGCSRCLECGYTKCE
ncbi:MAG: adenosylcobalamin-dependent ribonucleoside-diphosphate reductase [Chloroflexota bacterium]|nr:adenosylcobalamin-dependent ribonucleoside-diphosphate reductase [Chloroflexota bacterium]